MKYTKTAISNARLRGKSRKKTPQIVVCGLAHISEKIGRHYQRLAELLNVKITLVSFDATGNSAAVAKRFNCDLIVLDSGKFASLRAFLRALRLRPTLHCEVYHDGGSDFLRLLFVALAVVQRIPIVTWCRGGELLWWQKMTKRRRFVVWGTLRAARLVPYKQIHMPDQLDSLRISEEKRLFFHNRIPVSAEEPLGVAHRKGVLFANTWKDFRHPEIALEVALRLAPKYPDYKFFIAGHRYWAKEAYCIKEFEATISDHNLSQQITVLPFVKQPMELLRKCSVFLLPAEIVFLNYTWLEAMERGLVPVVSNRQGASRVVASSENGMIAEIDADAFTESVDYLLSDQDRLQEMADKARRQIIDNFNLDDSLPELVNAYSSQVWR